MAYDGNGKGLPVHLRAPEERERSARRLEQIERQLMHLRRMAEEDGHDLLVYLIHMAEVEARDRSNALTRVIDH
jgi:cytosine/adenosine deaminase-related metal-dependent hydrolase